MIAVLEALEAQHTAEPDQKRREQIRRSARALAASAGLACCPAWCAKRRGRGAQRAPRPQRPQGVARIPKTERFAALSSEEREAYRAFRSGASLAEIATILGRSLAEADAFCDDPFGTGHASRATRMAARAPRRVSIASTLASAIGFDA
jgi:hypothetical protein